MATERFSAERMITEYFARLYAPVGSEGPTSLSG
jgi:hypothetical protein